MGVIRFILALSVILGHIGGLFGFQMVDPAISVELFFIISGFYMAMILSEKYKSYNLFISNRFLKIFPAYYAVLFITLLLSFVYFYKTHNYENGLAGKILTYKGKMSSPELVTVLLPNFTVFGQDILFFVKVNPDYHLQFTTHYTDSVIALPRFLAVPQAWSISLELMFYLIAPLLVKLRSRTLITLGLLSLALRIVLYRNGLDFDPWTYRFFPSELLFFIAGILSYKFYRSNSFTRFNDALTTNYFTIGYTIVLSLLLFYQFVFVKQFLLIPLMVVFTLALPFIFDKLKKNKLDKKIGDFSYELYICHELCIYTLLTVLNRVSHNENMNKLIVVLFAIAFAYALSWLVTQKIDRYRQKRIKLSLARAAV